MKFLITKFIIFFTPLFVLYMLLSCITTEELKKYNSDFNLAIIDKHRRLDSIQSPKLIFAGGSNITFGINSAKIQQELNIPVVNLGLVGGVGLLFMLEELKHTIKSGDVVCLSIEYYLGLDGEYRIKKNVSAQFKEAEKYFNINAIDDISLHIEATRKNIDRYFVGPFSKEPDMIYYRAGFNEYGDLVSHLNLPQAKSLPGVTFVPRRWEGIDELNEFHEYAKSKNVTVFFLFPAYQASQYHKNKPGIERLLDDFSSDLTIKVLGTPLDFVYDEDCFFDSVYHLNKVGREQRTDKIIELLKRANKQSGFLPKG